MVERASGVASPTNNDEMGECPLRDISGIEGSYPYRQILRRHGDGLCLLFVRAAEPGKLKNHYSAGLGSAVYTKLTITTSSPNGGRLAAWKQPKLFSEEVREAFNPLRQLFYPPSAVKE
jgi:hypothetical protein